MITTERINRILSITESFQMHDVLMKVQNVVIMILDTLQEQIGICEKEITGWEGH